jgi:hypothetical protein
MVARAEFEALTPFPTLPSNRIEDYPSIAAYRAAWDVWGATYDVCLVERDRLLTLAEQEADEAERWESQQEAERIYWQEMDCLTRDARDKAAGVVFVSPFEPYASMAEWAEAENPGVVA